MNRTIHLAACAFLLLLVLCFCSAAYRLEAHYTLAVGNRVGLTLGRYDATQPLIIDPVLVYSTYIGGSGLDAGNGIAVDSDGNAYVTGIAVSPDFPLAHPLPTNSGLLGGQDAVVSKLSFDARTATLSLAYSTYLGGSSFDFGSGIAVDARGNAYVVGVTDSSDFPLAHSLPTSVSRGSQSAFVAKIRTEPFGDKDRDVDDGHDVRDWEKTGVENGGDR